MSGKKLFRNYLPLLFIIVLFPVPAFSQNLLAVLDIASDGSVPNKNCTLISDSISAILAKDTNYMQFERSMIPELLQQLAVDDAATACSDAQCLILIGNMIGANFVVGGSIRYENHLTQITLNMVNVAEKRAINTVSLNTGSSKSAIISKEIPALVADLLNPNLKPVASTETTVSPKHKRSFLTNPWVYVGTLFAGGLGAGAYVYEYYYKPAHSPHSEPEEKPPVEVPEDPSLYGDFPVRSE